MEERARIPVADILAASSRAQVRALAMRLGVEDYVIEDAAAACRAVQRLSPHRTPDEAVRFFEIPPAILEAGARRKAAVQRSPAAVKAPELLAA